jgi:hypothetical protein
MGAFLVVLVAFIYLQLMFDVIVATWLFFHKRRHMAQFGPSSKREIR